MADSTYACLWYPGLSLTVVLHSAMRDPSFTIRSIPTLLWPLNWSHRLTFFQSEWNLKLIVNLWISFFSLIFFMIKSAGFGALTEKERKHLTYRLTKFLFFKVTILMYVVDFGKLHKLWLVWFSLLGFIKMVAGLGRVRFERLAASSSVPLNTHLRIIVFLIAIFFSSLVGLFCGVKAMMPYFSLSTIVLANFEFLAVAIEALQSAVLNTIHVMENVLDLEEENHRFLHSSLLFFLKPLVFVKESDRASLGGLRNPSTVWVNRAGDLALYGLTLLHFLHLWSLRGLHFQFIDGLLLLQVRALVDELYKKAMETIKDRAAVMHSGFPDATAAQLAENNDDCAICKEEMHSAKTLPCGHFFHLGCIVSWQHQETASAMLCPTCRADVRKVPTPPPAIPEVPREPTADWAVRTAREAANWNLPLWPSYLRRRQVAPRDGVVEGGARGLGGGGGVEIDWGGGTHGMRGESSGNSDISLRDMLDQVREVVPQYPDDLILLDLGRTNSVEETILNLTS